MKNWIVESIILAIALLAFGILLNRGINNFTDRDRVVTVKGLAEMEVPADKVIWPLMYKDLGNDLTTLYTNIQSKNRTDRKSTRLNSSHVKISYAVFCLKKKKEFKENLVR